MTDVNIDSEVCATPTAASVSKPASVPSRSSVKAANFSTASAGIRDSRSPLTMSVYDSA